MRKSIVDIHTERINDLIFELTTLATEDILPSVKHVKRDLYGLSDSEILAVIGKKHPKSKDVTLWVRYAQEKVQEALGFLQQLSDELDDIEDEINRDEVNNARE